jgi:mRNA interferase RelE/StbE
MNTFLPDIPLPPEIKRGIKHAIRTLSVDPEAGEPLRRELEGLWKCRVRRYRIVYAIDRQGRFLRIVAVGQRRRVYEEVTERIRRK